MSLLEIDRLTIGFRRYSALIRQVEVECIGDVSLKVDRGEVLALFGASGAGKSLLAHAVLGLLPHNAVIGGTMRFDGQMLDAERQEQLRGNRMALIPQSISHLDPLASVGRQLRWAARRSGHGGNEPDLAETALARFGLANTVVGSYPHTLSGGMARRVMLAMTMLSQADLVIADEPTNGLDADNAKEVFRYLKSFAERGKAVIIISHDLDATLEVADRVTILKDGSVAAHEAAAGFKGSGEALASPYAKALWRALPQNEFKSGGWHGT